MQEYRRLLAPSSWVSVFSGFALTDMHSFYNFKSKSMKKQASVNSMAAVEVLWWPLKNLNTELP